MGSVGKGGVDVIRINGDSVSYERLNERDVYNDIRKFGFSRYIVNSDGTVIQANPNNPKAYITMSGMPLTSSNYPEKADSMFPNTTTSREDAVANKFKNETSLTVQGDDENALLSSGLTKAGFVRVGESRPQGYMPYHLWQKRK